VRTSGDHFAVREVTLGMESGEWLEIRRGLDEGDPLSYRSGADEFANAEPMELSALRVGYTEDFGICEVEEPIREIFRQRIAAVAPFFAECRPVSFDLGDADRCFDVLRAESFVAAFQHAYEEAPHSLGPNIRANYELGAAMTLADRAWAHAEQTRLFRNFQQSIAEFDIVLAPVTPLTPFEWREPYAREINGVALKTYYQWLALTYVVTLATNPALAMPCGTDLEGMPFGIQVIGKFRGDAALLRSAHALEHMFDTIEQTRRPRPDLASLASVRADLKSIVEAPPEPDAEPRSRQALTAV
jgi:Asp-tRNA(Asn)/Glu-tRNA(Gln) amidotransferase A subunit family amidase